MKNTTYTLGFTPSGNKYLGIIWYDSADTDMGRFTVQCHKNGNNYYVIGLKNSDGTNIYDGALRYFVSRTNERGFYPEGDTDLGTTNNKWKTLNGINPGALSLPNVRAAVADPIDTNGWNLSGSRNKYTPTEDGWFYIRVAGTGSCAINIHNGDTDNSYPTWFNTSTGGYATLVVPCEKGISLYIYISATSIEYCSFHPCLGNV